MRYIHTVIHEALDQAVKNGLVACNVSEATVLPAEEKKEISPLTREQVDCLLTAVKDDRLYPAILLEVATGLRRGELLALRWQDVDLKAGVLSVKQNLVRVRNHGAAPGERKTRLVFQEPKTPQSRRTVSIPEYALTELKRHKARQNQE
ncbi:site-specific integrase [Moorella sp. ACPs]|uniref:site-specific integrase n=1 Tax=Neomoorella carbonis TaxID=3062783 RepID=UPI00324FB0E7